MIYVEVKGLIHCIRLDTSHTTKAVAVGAGLAGVTTSAGGVLMVSTVVFTETLVVAVSQGVLASRALHVIQPDRTVA